MMNNTTLYVLTGLVLVSMAILLGLNLTNILKGNTSSQTYIKLNDVRGVAVEHNKLPYTLNFEQQVDVINLLNRSVKIAEITREGSRQKPNIDKIIIYRFEQPNLIIEPLTYLDNNLIFSLPEWNKEGYLMDISGGTLQQTLSNTYDH
jgi:hypothetical protein